MTAEKKSYGCKGCYYENKNIDKDIEKLDGFFNKGWCCDLDEIYSIVMNIVRENDKLKEIVELAETENEIKDKIINKLAEDIMSLPEGEYYFKNKEEVIEKARNEVLKDE